MTQKRCRDSDPCRSAGGRAPERSGERAGADIARGRETGSTFGYANERITRATTRFDSGIRVTPSFRLRRILPKKHNHPKMLVKSFISTKFQVSDSPRMVPEAGLMRPCPQEHMRPIGSISPGAIAHDRLGSARRVTNSQSVRESGGFQAAQGRNECATST